jgi:exopolysaccharide biosynthesis polyprenyl glycosylphosphotransferase
MYRNVGTTRVEQGFREFWVRNKLKTVLIAGDGTSIFSGFVISLKLTSFGTTYGAGRVVLIASFATLAGLWSTRAHGLLLARVSAIRVVEMTRLARAMVVLGVLVLLLDRIAKTDLHIRYTVFACATSFLVICISRSIFRSWLTAARVQGRYRRNVAIVGTDEEAVRLRELLRTHTDIGMTVVGVIGPQREAEDHWFGTKWLGESDQAETILERMNVQGVVITPGGLNASRLNELVRNLHTAGRHVHLGTGISGIDARRLRALPLAYEPLFYVEAPNLAKSQLSAKRWFDIASAACVIVVLAPVLLAIALAVKLGDRGPVLFKQTRVGRSGRTFGVYKFRSMQVDAEARLAEVQSTNERIGPLFKMERDPRITRVGKFLRDSSLDELPQLFNVLKGEMSLVGPRPALPAEVLAFSADLRLREQVRPGITGLWQVEARDSPSFEAYRRLDLFYVENWSLTLDLIIVLGTVEQILFRLIRIVVSRRVHGGTQQVAEVQVLTVDA